MWPFSIKKRDSYADLLMKITDLSIELKGMKADIAILEQKMFKRIKPQKREIEEAEQEQEIPNYAEISKAFGGDIPIELLQNYKK